MEGPGCPERRVHRLYPCYRIGQTVPLLGSGAARGNARFHARLPKSFRPAPVAAIIRHALLSLRFLQGLHAPGDLHREVCIRLSDFPHQGCLDLLQLWAPDRRGARWAS